MSYSRRQLEALGEPLGDSVTYKKLGGGYVAGFGGDSPSPQSQPSSTSQTTSNIPDWAIPYATKNLGNAEALTDINQNPYQTYKGERVAGFTDLQKKSQADIAGMQTAPQLGQATGMAGTAGIGGLMAGQNYQNMATNPNTMSQYMSPYQQNVTDFQKQQAVMDYGRQLPGLSAAAIGKGAFGGNRQAIVESEAQRNLQNQLAGIQATGSQNAFQNAQQAQQFGANLGLQGFNLAGQQAATLGQLGQTQYGQQMGINAAQQQAGAQQQAQEQQGLSNAYQDFLNKQNNPYKQIGFMSDILRGTPTSGGAQSIYNAPPSGVSQFAGLAGGLGSLYGAYNASNRGYAEGGEIKNYAEGGIVAFADGGEIAPLPNAAEFGAVKNINAGKSTLDQELGMGADLRRLLMASMQLKNLQKREDILKLQAQIQNATGGSAQPDTTVAADVSNMLRQEVENSAAENAPERQGGIADLDTGNLGENYAGGGIVAFSRGGESEADKLERENRLQFLKDSGLNLAKAAATPFTGAWDAVKGVFHPLREVLYTTGLTQGNPEYKSTTMSMWADPAAAASAAAPAASAAASADPAAPPAAAPAPRASVAAAPRAPAPAAVEPSDAEYTRLMSNLTGDRTKAISMMESGQRTPETVLTAEGYANRDLRERNAYLKARGLPTAEESMKERIDNLATAGKEARNNRDVDRWMAAAQGFFAMGAGKSQYAMQNMAEGLNMGVKELRAVEQDYRKVDQLQKDKAELLKEATRQEAKGDFAKGDALRKEAEERNKGIADIKLKTGAHLLESFDRTAATATAAKAATDARRDAALARISATQGQNNYVNMLREQGIAETQRKNKESENQKYADMQARLRDRHPLMTKGTLPNKLTELSDARLRLATAPTKPSFIQDVNNLTVEVDRMQDQVAMDTAKDAKRFVKAGNSEWGTLQTTGGKK